MSEINSGKGWARTISRFLLIILILAAPSAAETPFALVRVLSGDAKLDQKSVKVPTLATAGQVLWVPSKSEVRVQLLGKNSEVVVKGPATLSLTAETLSPRSTRVDRGALTPTEGLAGFSEAAALVTRGTLQLYPSMPPEKVGADYAIYFGTPEERKSGDPKALGGKAFRLEIIDRGGPHEVLVYGRNFGLTAMEEIPNPLPLSKVKLMTGRPYLLRSVTETRDGKVVREMPFRLLSSDESNMLDSLEQKARAATQDKTTQLLELAQVCLSMDQPGRALKALSAIDQATMSGEQLDTLKAQIKFLQRNLSMPIE